MENKNQEKELDLIDLINKNLKKRDIKSVLNYITYLVQTDINRVEIFEKTASQKIKRYLYNLKKGSDSTLENAQKKSNDEENEKKSSDN